MKPLKLLIILLVLATVGCQVCPLVFKYLAVPLTRAYLADDDKADDDKDEETKDESEDEGDLRILDLGDES